MNVRKALAALTLAVVAVFLLPVSAIAGEPGSGPSGGAQGGGGGTSNGGGTSSGGGSSGGGTTTGGDSGGQQAGSGPTGPVTGGQSSSHTEGTCVLYANQASFGGLCGQGSSGGGETFRQILAGQPFPQCRFGDLPADVTPPLPPKGKTGTWKIQTCLRNVTIDGVVPGKKMAVETSLVFFPAGTVARDLTPQQEAVWRALASAYPVPIVLTGPVIPPRVNVPTTFWLGVTGPDTARAHRVTITDAGKTFSTLVITSTAPNNTALRAFVQRTFIWPGRSVDEKPIMCIGGGVPQPGAASQTPATGACAFTYDRSSAFAPGNVYTVGIEADWAVEYQAPNGQWVQLGQAPITTTYKMPVQEIQTINN